MLDFGIETFFKSSYKNFRKARIGVLCNQASNTKDLRHISQVITDKRYRLDITCFIGPQHGIRGEKQDNMVESDDFIDPISGLPVFSLYGASRVPTPAILDKVDTFLIDLQDIGTRIYTFMYTMANCMRAAASTGKKVVILDRPNPIGGLQIEGNVLEEGFTSFVGQFPICVRHGLTMGELALLFNDAFGIKCDLEVIKLKGWSRKTYADEWGRDWVPPSPNIPTLNSAIVFPGMVLFEGTNVSEGRGTTKPFEYIGAPYIYPDKLANEMNSLKIPGVYFRAIYFQPTYQKWKDQVCGGVQVHVTNRKQFNAYYAGICLLEKIAHMYPNDFQWKQPPYEYEYEKMPIDLIVGSSVVRFSIEGKKSLAAFHQYEKDQLREFGKLAKEYHLYK